MERQARAGHDLEEGFAWNGQTFGSLSQIAKAMTGTNWNGHRFFGLRQGKTSQQTWARIAEKAEIGPPSVERMARRLERVAMKDQTTKRSLALRHLHARLDRAGA